MKVVVLAGGISTERQVSLVSGAEICKALRRCGHKAILVDMFLGNPLAGISPEQAFDEPDGFLKESSIGKDAPSLDEIKILRGGNPDCHLGVHVLDLCMAADFVFLGLHGQDGEDGKIQALLDLLGIPYSGSDHVSSAMAMDKIITKKIMDSAGIRTAPYFEVTANESNIETLAETLPVPCAVKTPCGGSSIGVVLADTREELFKALREISAFSPRILVEKKIKGRELTVPVFDSAALPAIEIVPPDGTYFDYTAKYQSGEAGASEICPAPITEQQYQEMSEMALKLHHSLGLSVYSRTDFILDEDGIPWCLEVNTLPGMTPASLLPKSAAYAGIPYDQLCEKIMELSFTARKHSHN